jgi:hypothetical protein
MFQPTQPSSGVLKFGGNCCVFCSTAIGVFAFIIFLNEVNVAVEGTEGETTLTSF